MKVLIDNILRKFGLVRINKVAELLEYYARFEREKSDLDFNLGRTYVMHYVEDELGVLKDTSFFSKKCKKCKHAKVGCYYSDECPIH
jgi:hypothetical protein